MKRTDISRCSVLILIKQQASCPSARSRRLFPSKMSTNFVVNSSKIGGRLVAVIAPDYPDAERVREGICDVLETVETYEVVGKWVTSRSGA